MGDNFKNQNDKKISFITLGPAVYVDTLVVAWAHFPETGFEPKSFKNLVSNRLNTRSNTGYKILNPQCDDDGAPSRYSELRALVSFPQTQETFDSLSKGTYVYLGITYFALALNNFLSWEGSLSTSLESFIHVRNGFWKPSSKSTKKVMPV